MKPAPSRIVIMVRGGLVQSIHTDALERTEIKVFDLDQGSFETPAEKANRQAREAEYERSIVGMIEVPI